MLQNLVRRQLIVTLVLIVVLFMYIQVETDPNVLKARIGLLSSMVGISFCASPLSNVVSNTERAEIARYSLGY